MTFVIDKEELKPGLILFRRADVQHRNWYCRVKLPKADRYKTVSLKTADINTARSLAWDQDGEVRYAIKHDVPLFNHSFRDVGREYLKAQEARAARGEITKLRPEKMRAIIEGPLEAYAGSTQVHRISEELWSSYPAWRRETGEGRSARNGGRRITRELATALVAQTQAMREKTRLKRGLRPRTIAPDVTEREIAAKAAASVPYVSDATIRFEMSIFGVVMQYAIKKRYVPASRRFDDRPKLKKMRRDEFTAEEYTQLYRFARDKWAKGKPAAPTDGELPREQRGNSLWYRTVAYNFVLVMCNTGMRPSEAKNLRWRDVTTAKDRDGRPIMVLFVQGKGKQRKLVAPESVGKYLDRIRAISKATAPDDAVFTIIDGTPAKSLYKVLIDDLLTQSGLRMGPGGTMRSTYSFRHTYATFRLGEGVDVYFLAEQMGTSVKMIEDHYGHVNTIKHADRVLQGIGGWDPVEEQLAAALTETTAKADAKARQAAATRDKDKTKATRPASPRRRAPTTAKP